MGKNLWVSKTFCDIDSLYHEMMFRKEVKGEIKALTVSKRS